MDSYEESPIKQEPISISVFKRPGMYFGDLDDGTGYANIVAELVDTILSWKTGANLTVTLQPDRIEVACYARLPDAEIPYTYAPRRPFSVLYDGMANLGYRWFTAPLHAHAFVCRHAVWELRDGGEEQSALIDEGICLSAKFSAPDLPEDLCFRVSLSIGTTRLPFAQARLDQVIQRIRYMGGPAEAGYWGCVTVRDERIGETKAVVVTNYPPRPSIRSA